MQNSKSAAVFVFVCVWLVTAANAIKFELVDGTKLEGEITLVKPAVLQIRTNENRYVDVEWNKLSQATLIELKEFALTKKNTKLLEHIEPYIEIPLDIKIKKTEVAIKEVPRQDRPAKGSLLGAMFSSSVGIICMLLLYAANIYAGYEIAVIRAYPPATVCGIAAVAPVIGPVIFLCLPTNMTSSREEIVAEEPAAPAAPYSATYTDPASPRTSAPQSAPDAEPASHAPAASALPKTQVFKRGQFTFNRRFIETKFAGFFGMVRKDAEEDLLLIVKTARGEFVATRISNIAANEMHVDVHAGGASQQVHIPLVEILEMQIKHKDA